MKQLAPRAACALALLATTLACARQAFAHPPAPRLSGTGLFVAGSTTVVRKGNLPFAPQYPLWTDGARKRRFIRLPAGTAIDASRPDAWQFPPGTFLWKEFAFAGRPIETRTLERLPNGRWRYATYVWDEAGTDAWLAPAAGVPQGIEVQPGVRHVIPGAHDCRACHEGRRTPVLGFSALQLSPDRDPQAPHAEPPPTGALDLHALVARRLVHGLPAAFITRPPRIAAPTATARAALGYLHANCGTCHNDEGPLAPLGLSLAQRLTNADSAASVLETITRTSQFTIPGSVGPSYRVVPGAPDLSALVFRMRARDPISQMPPLGTALVDGTGVELIERWIAELEQTDTKEKP